MSGTVISCRKKQVFQVRARVPDGPTGKKRDAIAGEVPGMTLRLSATEGGTAINAAVDNLPASERSADPAIRYVEVSKTLMETHALGLGVGAHFWAIWKDASGFDKESKEFIVADGTTL